MCTKRGRKRCYMLRLHLRQRAAERPHLPTHEPHGRLRRNRIHLTEKGIDEIRIGDLHVARLFHLAVKIKLAHIVSRLRRYVRKHGNDPLSSQRKNRHDLVVISGIDCQIIPAGVA